MRNSYRKYEVDFTLAGGTNEMIIPAGLRDQKFNELAALFSTYEEFEYFVKCNLIVHELTNNEFTR